MRVDNKHFCSSYKKKKEKKNLRFQNFEVQLLIHPALVKGRV